MEACAFRPERLGEPSFRKTLTRRPGFDLEPTARRPNEKTGTRASGVPAGTARPLNCHDPGTRRTGNLESGRLLRAGGLKVKSGEPEGAAPDASLLHPEPHYRHARPLPCAHGGWTEIQEVGVGMARPGGTLAQAGDRGRLRARSRRHLLISRPALHGHDPVRPDREPGAAHLRPDRAASAAARRGRPRPTGAAADGRGPGLARLDHRRPRPASPRSDRGRGPPCPARAPHWSPGSRSARAALRRRRLGRAARDPGRPHRSRRPNPRSGLRQSAPAELRRARHLR